MLWHPRKPPFYLDVKRLFMYQNWPSTITTVTIWPRDPNCYSYSISDKCTRTDRNAVWRHFELIQMTWLCCLLHQCHIMCTPLNYSLVERVAQSSSFFPSFFFFLLAKCVDEKCHSLYKKSWNAIRKWNCNRLTLSLFASYLLTASISLSHGCV